MDSTASEASFDRFYRASAKSMVAFAFLLTGDSGHAQELAQEAFTRAWMKWPTVERYDSPDAWVRHVLHNLCVSDWRAKRGYRFVPLLDIDKDYLVPDATDRLTVSRALRRLPKKQCEAVFLHDALGHTVPDIAREMSVPPGTVKSWISRAHAILLPALQSHPVA
jgi:RNA polymerase sigma-70 factor (ECF subfamily)